MSKINPTTRIEIEGWPFRIKKPLQDTEETKLMLLLHGHLGDENAMWILTKPLPATYTLLAPRAPIQTGTDSYSWHEILSQWPDIDTYQSLSGDLLTRVNHWLDDSGEEVGQIHVMGFSQGAVMAFALSILHPDLIGKVAALAGFIPQSWKNHLHQDSLLGKEFYIAHGTQDDVVPIKKARQAAKWLKEKGSHVTFCEADIGHKLSANCFNGLGEFFR